VKPEKIVEFLSCLGVPHANKGKRTGNVVSRCPLGPWKHEGGQSSPEVFGVKIEQGDPKANCFACGFKGSLGLLMHKVRSENKLSPSGLVYDFKRANELLEEAEASQEFDFDIPGIEERLAAGKKGLHEFPAWWLETFPSVQEALPAMSYLHKRGVTPAIAEQLDLRWDPAQQRICFPVRDFNGVLRGLHGRAIHEKTDPRYRMYTQAGTNNPIVWLGESWVDLDKPILVVEGPFDLASVLRVYPNSVTPLFASPSDAKLKRMGDAMEWFTFFDNGTGGDNGRARVDKLFGKDHVIKHVVPPTHRKDPGECGVNDLLTCLVDLVPSTAL
jgi:hypothetical protein